ncbi:MAG: T9SS type A sorting domain-containing protein [Bacteroidia bacterium]
MIKQLFNNLYTLLIVLVLLTAAAKAQIIYTDLVPDISDTCVFNYGGSCNHVNNFDLNNDGNDDFGITVYNTFHSGVWCNSQYYSYSEIGISAVPLDSNEIAIANGNSAIQFNLSDTIGSLQSWVNSGTLLSKTIYFYFPCPNPGGIFYGNGHLGLKLVKNGLDYFGWIRLNVNPNTPSYYSCTIYDFAFNNAPGQFILAGDTGSGSTGIVETSFSKPINIYPNPFFSSAILTFDSNIKIENALLDIFDMAGRKVKQIEIKSKKTEIRKENLSSGIYIFKVQSRNEIIGTGKIIVQ